jgi:hypothetical protein
MLRLPHLREPLLGVAASTTTEGRPIEANAGDGRAGRCQASAGATVKDQPEPVSTISRNSVKDQVTPFCPAHPERQADSRLSRVRIATVFEGIAAHHPPVGQRRHCIHVASEGGASK